MFPRISFKHRLWPEDSPRQFSLLPGFVYFASCLIRCGHRRTPRRTPKQTGFRAAPPPPNHTDPQSYISRPAPPVSKEFTRITSHSKLNLRPSDNFPSDRTAAIRPSTASAT
ncbi:hypothetical protein BU26DRAFT_236720 [Trematosphaeria pertusa]|uniref:Uncharacterized protein n=1 Tax=Trematosphaeria pertusa TaxID=390896 RepID=A0A6A6HS72_9PLEO|nr:uncharacterized protein BU26DRAFT_236720 [Trematosphaeria pertusa]KAF2240373.1 hypothetical protein BU26DRAFT_236720 [Trematosphaeria pertusa]